MIKVKCKITKVYSLVVPVGAFDTVGVSSILTITLPLPWSPNVIEFSIRREMQENRLLLSLNIKYQESYLSATTFIGFVDVNVNRK